MSADRSGNGPDKTVGPDDATSQRGGEHAHRADSADPDSADFRYDEFALFAENCAEYGLPWDGAPEVVRVGVELDGHGELSMLRWGRGTRGLVVLHGSAQNAHTWDTVALALRPTPLLAVDLPGHGRSFWRDDGGYGPHAIAEAVARGSA